MNIYGKIERFVVPDVVLASWRGRDNMRKFASVSTPCKAGCRYCFAKWSNLYKRPEPLLNRDIMDSEEIILYPSCDGEFFDQDEIIKKIKHYSKSRKKVYVSLSCKVEPTDGQLLQLEKLDKWLRDENKGFVKFAISLSCRTRLSEIEPGTMTYEERLNLARRAYNLGIATSLTIKPILPFISADEYISIIYDFKKYLSHVLVGGLYVDRKSRFYNEYLSKYPCVKREVNWIEGRPEWDYIESKDTIEKIKHESQKWGIMVFDSDAELVINMRKEVV